MIHDFPHWSGIELEDRPVFSSYFEREQPVASELSFENLFAWRRSYNFLCSALDGALCVVARPEGKPPFFLPPIGAEDPIGCSRRLFEHLRDEGQEPAIHRAPAEFVATLGDEFLAEPDRANWDYVYRLDDMAALAGRKYHKKRNQIAQFRARYEYEYRRITGDLIPYCEELQERWCQTRDCLIPGNTSLAEENHAVLEGLYNFERLDLFGGAILVEGNLEAFSIAGRLNGDTMAIHFEKGSPSYPGIYQVINREFCADAPAGYTFVNREQDLGDPGLRQAKESYYPHHMVEKYIVTAR